MDESGCWLVADVGATQTRLALVEPDEEGFPIHERRSFPTREFSSLEAVIELFLEALEGPAINAACLAVAGPVRGGEATLTNGEWTVSSERVGARLHLADVLVVNDFHAVAASLPQLRDADLHPIGMPAVMTANPHSAKVVLGPGTGLGMAGLVLIDGQWQVIASEGGHAALAPVGELELEVARVLLARFGFVSWEHVLSGPGLENLYGAVSAVWGARGTTMSAADISARALDHEPVCHRTLELFCSMLGTAAGGLAYTFCAQGGVYLAGGILPRISQFLTASDFRERFEAVGGSSDYLRTLSTILVRSADAGLLGAAVALARHKRRGGKVNGARGDGRGARSGIRGSDAGDSDRV